jgi:CBS domain-containing protein
LPVVDNGRLAGWVSRIDILRALEQHQPLDEPLTYEREGSAIDRHAATIADLMYQDVPVVQPGATLEAVLQALEQDRRRRAVVVDDNRQVLGIITDGDLLQRSQHAAHPGFLARLRSLVTGQAADAAFGGATTETAVDLMTAPVITISLQATPEEALRLVLQHGVKRLPVVDENGRLVGLLSRASLLRGLLGNVEPSVATDR